MYFSPPVFQIPLSPHQHPQSVSMADFFFSFRHCSLQYCFLKGYQAYHFSSLHLPVLVQSDHAQLLLKARALGFQALGPFCGCWFLENSFFSCWPGQVMSQFLREGSQGSGDKNRTRFKNLRYFQLTKAGLCRPVGGSNQT